MIVTPIAVAIAVLVGLGAAIVLDELRSAQLGRHHLGAFAFAACCLAGLLPVLGASLPGRYSLPESGYDAVLSWTAAPPSQATGSRLLWLGDPQAIPGGSWQIRPGLAADLSEGGLPRRHPPLPLSPNPGRVRAIAAAIAEAQSGTTVRLGSLLAPFGIHYLVVPAAPAPVLPGGSAVPIAAAPESLLDGLSEQSDLRELPTEGDAAVFQNTVWEPSSGAVPASGVAIPSPVRILAVAAEVALWGAVGLFCYRERRRRQSGGRSRHLRPLAQRRTPPRAGAGGGQLLMATSAQTLGADRRRRHLALGLVLGLLALAGVANATVKHHRAETSDGPASAVGAVVVSHRASSSAWYCPGPLPIGVGQDSAAIELANVTSHTVRGELDLVTSSGQNALHAVVLPPESTQRTTFPTPKKAGWGAASVLLNGLGVGVSEIEHGPAGAVSSPCTTTISSSAAIVGGSTRQAANVALALFDPGATPAVAHVSFSTGVSSVSPPAFQGIAIGAGQVVVENVGEFLPQQQTLATMVQSTGGRIVVGTMNSDVLGHARTLGFSSGVATPSRTWLLPPAPSGGAAAQSYLVLNTSPRTTEVALRTAASGASLGPATVLRDVLSGEHGRVQPRPRRRTRGALRWGEVTASNGTAIVVERSLVIPRPISVPELLSAPGSAARSPLLLPATVPSGLSEVAGTPLPAEGWLLTGGESDAATGEIVTLVNPGDGRVQVHLQALDASGRTNAAIARIGTITLAPRSVVPVDLGASVRSARALALVVRADGAVGCGAYLYAKGSSGSVGFNASAAIPLE